MPTIYLIPECDTNEEFRELLQETFQIIFEEELGGWWRAQSVWPPERTLALFQTWFDCRFNSLVLDLFDEAQTQT